MLRFPVLNLPEELTYLLKMNLSSVELQNKIVLEKINQNYALVQQLETLFEEYDSQKRLPQVLKKISWNQFRDKFSSIYIYHSVHGGFPHETKLDLVRDIQVFEDQLSDFSQLSNSRAFLLGFYLKCVQIQLRKEFGDSKVNLIELPKGVISLMGLSSSKSEKVDILILLVWHLFQFLGADSLSDSIKQGKNYEDIYLELGQEQKDILIENFLAYGCSINETEVFFNNRV